MASGNGVSPAATGAIAAAAGIAGVLLAGWMARSRERWTWRADNRRDAYLDLLRALEEVRQSFDEVSEEVREAEAQGIYEEFEGHETFRELARRAREAARQLDAARAKARLVGSRKIRRFLEKGDISSVPIETRNADAGDIARQWAGIGDEKGWSPMWGDWVFEWIDYIEECAVAELRPDRVRALLHRLGGPVRQFDAWRRRRRVAKMFAKAKKATSSDPPPETTST